jgi:hypothetical protein
MDDHHQEVIAYCRENGFNGLMADDGEYAVFDPPRYFSSEHLKLTYKVRNEVRYCERYKINLVLEWYKKNHIIVKLCPSFFLSKTHCILMKFGI